MILGDTNNLSLRGIMPGHPSAWRSAGRPSAGRSAGRPSAGRSAGRSTGRPSAERSAGRPSTAPRLSCPYVCKCDAAFAVSSALTRHKRAHTVEKPSRKGWALPSYTHKTFPMEPDRRPSAGRSAGRPSAERSAGHPSEWRWASSMDLDLRECMGPSAGRSTGRPSAGRSAGRPSAERSAGRPSAERSAGRPSAGRSSGCPARTPPPTICITLGNWCGTQKRLSKKAKYAAAADQAQLQQVAAGAGAAESKNAIEIPVEEDLVEYVGKKFQMRGPRVRLVPVGSVN